MSSTPAAPELPTVLLAEDSRTVAALIARDLKGLYNVILTRDGEEAWNALCANPAVDLVITDVQMPRMTGHELLLKIRASDIAQLKNVPVIVMTSTEEKSERDLAFANGANDFLTKPVDRTELQARVGVHKKLTGTTRELETNRQTLQEQATVDPLTQLKNRRAFLQIAESYWALTRRHKHELSLIMFDVDHLQNIHDAHGQAVVNSVLTGVAQILAGTTRIEDTAARISEEQFVILPPNTNGAGAAVLAERIRGTIEKKSFPLISTALPVTVSAGVASYGADETAGVEALLQVAGERLTRAKQNGHNRIVTAGRE